VLPPGRVVSARKPAAMRNWMTVPMTVVDTVFKALAPACPDRVLAGHHADLNISGAFGFVDPATGGLYPGSFEGMGVIGGGFGAKCDEDGVSATICLNDGDTHNSPVEAKEAKGPLVVVRRELRPDSGGAGRFRGGLGVVQECEALVAAMYQAQVERTRCAPWGLLGGRDGLPNAVALRRRDGSLERFDTGKVRPCRLEAGDRWIAEVGGGGGVYDPLDRPADQVLADVRAGYVSARSAREDYGVVVVPNGRSVDLDAAATARLRVRPHTTSRGESE
jgi:N-methylhydantoinase B